MRKLKAVSAFLVFILFLSACDYIVLPEEEASDSLGVSKGWHAMVTAVGKNENGDLHVDITLRNDTADWSTFQTTPNTPARLTTSDGKTSDCETILVSTGQHRLAPGFQIRGYTAGTKKEPKTQLLYIECAGDGDPKGAKIAFDYTYYSGWYNYYDKTANKTPGTMEVKLDELKTDLTYPVVDKFEGLIISPDTKITALNDCILTLASVTRTDTGLDFTWVNTNPGEYPSYVHIGHPSVVGSDGIIYGFYESPDIASVPVSQPGKSSEWTTSVAVPKDVTGLYIMANVETKQQRMFANYALDITDK
ncbi:MAG: hypothetical protein AB9891_05365 [Anaerolineaceae bacterium]